MSSAIGQKNTLIAWIGTLEKEYEISFSYNANLLKGVTFDHCENLKTLEDNIRCFNTSTNLQINIVDGTYYTITIPDEIFEEAIVFQLFDSDFNDPLPSFLVKNQGGKQWLSNTNGVVTIHPPHHMDDTLYFGGIGYDRKELLLRDLIFSGNRKVMLVPSLDYLEEVVIKNYLADGFYSTKPFHGIHIKQDDLALLPGATDTDVFTSLQTIPGIGSPNARAGNTVVRGSAFDQNFILFDEVPIYHRGHYFGTISPYNAQVVNHVDVYRSGYTSRYGGRLGGAIKINTINKTEDSLTGTIAANMIYGALNVSAPVNKKSSLMIGIRGTPFGRLKAPKMKEINDMVFAGSGFQLIQTNPSLELRRFHFDFSDINAVYNVELGEKNTIKLSLLDVRNQLETDVYNFDVNKLQTNKVDLLNTGGSLVWNYFPRTGVTFKTTLVTSSYKHYYGAVGYKPNYEDKVFENGVKDYQVRESVLIKNGTRDVLELGADISYQSTYYKNSYSNSVITDTTTFFDTVQAYIPSVFVEYKLNRFDRFTAQVGVRTLFYSPTAQLRVEPRLSINYEVSESILLKGSSGLYSQYINRVDNLLIDLTGIEHYLLAMSDGEKVPMATSFQNMVGGTFHKAGWVFDIEFYSKNISGLSYYENDFETNGDYFHTISQNAFGADLLLKKDWKNLTTSVGYSYSMNEYSIDTGSVSESVEINYNKPHSFSLSLMYKRKNTSISIGWWLSSGIPKDHQWSASNSLYTIGNSNGPSGPPIGSDGIPLGPPPVSELAVEEFSADRSPMFSQVDLSIVQKLEPKRQKWCAEVGVSVLNVFDRDNLIDQVRRGHPSGDIYFNRYAIGFSPNAQLSISW